MTRKPVLIILIVAIILTAALLLGCNDWDGMDRTGPAWASPTPPPTVVQDWHQNVPQRR